MDARTNNKATSLSYLIPGILAFICAIPLALVIYFVDSKFQEKPEQGVMLLGVFFALVITFPVMIYLIKNLKNSDPGTLGIIILTTIAIILVSIYLFRVSSFIKFPADILIWSESDFVNDILKIRTGYPLYTDQLNNDSFVYPPAAQILTYLLSVLLGRPTSIPTYRAIQLAYIIFASLGALLCIQKIVQNSTSDPLINSKQRWIWAGLWFPLLFLFATNSLTNPFVINLHNDALALLITIIAYLILLTYAISQNRKLIYLMAIIPAIGFLIKQNIAIWLVLYSIQIALFDRPRSIKRLILYLITSFSLLGLTFGVCYLLWGENFIYWIITVMGQHAISPLRSFKHLLDIWLYLVIGILGGVVLLRGTNYRVLLGPWLIWLVLILIETYTSGIAWMINHIGPGCLLAGVWFLAALPRIWYWVIDTVKGRPKTEIWLQTGIMVGIVGLMFNGLGFVNIPVKPISNDEYRYINQIEDEFMGKPAESILLDAGTWVYIPDVVIMKDRAPSIGERGYTQTGDFSGIIKRIEQKQYAKILVRNLHSPDFWYEYFLWSHPSGIRQALIENYREIRTIEAVANNDNYLFAEISVLVPNGQ